MIINESQKELVTADQVDHSSYSRIFQCPHCHSTLTWRAGYARKGIQLSPSFVHSQDAPNDCPLRVSFQTSVALVPRQDFDDLIIKGQNSKRLEKAFISHFKWSFQNSISRGFLVRLNWSIGGGYRSTAKGRIIHDAIISSWLRHYTTGSLSYSQVSVENLKQTMAYNKEVLGLYFNPGLLVEAVDMIFKFIQIQQYINQGMDNFEKWLFSSQDLVKKFLIDGVEECATVGSIEEYHSKFEGQEDDAEFRRKCCENIEILTRLERYEIIKFQTQKEVDFLKTYVEQLPLEDLMKVHCKQARGIIRYLRKGCSDKLRKAFLEIAILGDERLPVDVIRQFQEEDLENMTRDFRFLRNSFEDFAEGKESVGSRLVKFSLSQSLEAIQNTDWSQLPNCY